MKKKKLIKELALALRIASITNRNGMNWATNAPFQTKINKLLKKAHSHSKTYAELRDNA